MRITDEKVHDSMEFKKIMDPAVKKQRWYMQIKDMIQKKYTLSNNGIEAVIPPKKNATTKARGSPLRAKLVREIKKIGE